MLDLPLELQWLTIDAIHDTSTLINLLDSLPSTAPSTSRLILRRLFAILNTERTRKLETLECCRAALFELRDLVGVSSLIPKFDEIVSGINDEIAHWEAPVQFRGLRHPDASLAILKKRRYETYEERKTWWDGELTVDGFMDKLYARQI